MRDKDGDGANDIIRVEMVHCRDPAKKKQAAGSLLARRQQRQKRIPQELLHDHHDQARGMHLVLVVLSLSGYIC